MIRSFRPHIAIDTVVIPSDRWRHWGTARSPCPVQRGRTELNPNTGLQGLHSYPLCCAVLSCLVMPDSLRPHGLYRPPGFSVHGDSPGRNIGVGCHAPLQAIFPSQGSNPGLPHCGQILSQLSHHGSPRILEWVASPFSRASSGPRNQTGVSCTAGGFFTSWATREALLSIIL